MKLPARLWSLIPHRWERRLSYFVATPYGRRRKWRRAERLPMRVPVLPAAFWQSISPGWFLQWAVAEEQLREPAAAIKVHSERYGGPICGSVPANWNGTVVTLHADDAACGLLPKGTP